MDKTLDLLCIAGICADMLFSRIPFIPKAGQESYAEDFAIKAGGGANTPVAAAKLGLRTALMTMVGKDSTGEMLSGILSSAGVDTSGVCRSPVHSTSISAVMSLAGGERAFASYDKLDLGMMDLKLLEQMVCRTRHIHTYHGYCQQLPILELAHQYGCTVSFDASFDPRQTLDDLLPFLEKVHIFLPNEQEACQLAGTTDFPKAAELLGEHVPILVIKLGEKGALLRTERKTTLIPGFSCIDVIDTTGAGDNFIAGFLYGYLRGLPLEDCIHYANASGAVSVTLVGGVDEGYTKKKVEALLLQ